jgi:sorbitol-specific phosphotransferase system component IIC
MKTTGIVLLLIGLVLTVFTAFKFFTKEKVVDLGAVEITRNEPHNVSWSPVIGIVVMVAGGIVFWKGSKSK